MSKSIVELYQEKANGTAPTTTEVATRDVANLMTIMGELPNPDPILRKAGKHITVYEDLLYDDQVGHAVETLELSIAKESWEIDPNGAGDEWAAKCEAMIENWDNERIFGEIASARLFGFQPMEVLWTLDGSWQIRDIVGKPPEWFFYNSENQLRLRKIGVSAGLELPPYKFITPRNKPSFKNPYGVAALSRCFWPVAFKKGGLKFWLMMIEKYGIDKMVGKQPRGAGKDATDKLLTSLENMIQDAVAVIPDDSSVEILTAQGKTASGDLFEKFARYMDQKISQAIQGQTLTSSQGDGAGSYALGSVHENTFDNVKGGIMKLIINAYNEALEMYTLVNRGGPAPKFQFKLAEDVQAERAERDVNLANTKQIRFTAKYWKERYGLDDDEFEVLDPSQAGPPMFSSPVRPTGPPGCRCGCGGNAEIHFEQAMSQAFPEQDDLDRATKDTKRQKRALQQQMQKMLQPVIDIINSGDSFESMSEQVAELYPDLKSDEVEERLARAMFAAQVWGRISEEREELEDE